MNEGRAGSTVNKVFDIIFNYSPVLGAEEIWT